LQTTGTIRRKAVLSGIARGLSSRRRALSGPVSGAAAMADTAIASARVLPDKAADNG